MHTTSDGLAAEAWAVSTSALPIAFSQVREDPRLDLELAESVPAGGTIAMIASGGDTAACLGRLPVRIHLVDMNPAQVALSRLKWELAGADAEEAASVLGHRPMDAEARRAVLRERIEGLGLPHDVLGPPEFVAEVGPDYAGRYEVTFAELRKRLNGAHVEAALRAQSPVAIKHSYLGQTLSAAFREVFALPNLVRLFGAEATQNPRRPFAEHFFLRTCEVFEREAPYANPFLWQMLAGKSPVRPDWLQACGKPLIAKAVWHQGRMDSVLEGLGPVDLVHLSNILDWLSVEDATAVLHRARRALRPGGRVIIRQLNSLLEIPSLDAGFRWDIPLGDAMQRRDRSFFYPKIFVGVRR